jgi:hypothetical protein
MSAHPSLHGAHLKKLQLGLEVGYELASACKLLLQCCILIPGSASEFRCVPSLRRATATGALERKPRCTAPDVAPIDSYRFVPLVPRADSLVYGRRHMPLHPLCERTAASVPKGHSVRTKSAMGIPLSLHVVRTVLELFQKLAIQAFKLQSGVFGDLTPWPATADLWSHRISSTAPSILRWHSSIPQSPPCLPALPMGYLVQQACVLFLEFLFLCDFIVHKHLRTARGSGGIPPNSHSFGPRRRRDSAPHGMKHSLRCTNTGRCECHLELSSLANKKLLNERDNVSILRAKR